MNTGQQWVGRILIGWICGAALLCVSTYGGSEGLEMLVMGGNVSSRPILEFRARKVDISNHSPGHAYVLMGRELDDGLRFYNAVGGFYPDTDGSKVQSFKAILLAPGKVSQTLDDAK